MVGFLVMMPIHNMEFAEYQNYAKTKNPCFLVGGLVVEIIEPIAEKARIGLLEYIFESGVAQKDMMPKIVENIYDPDFPESKSDQQRWAQGYMVSYIETNGLLGKFRAMARCEEA